MLGRTFAIRSNVQVGEECPMKLEVEGTEHVLISFGVGPEPFELVLHQDTFRALLRQGGDTLGKINANESDTL